MPDRLTRRWFVGLVVGLCTAALAASVTATAAGTMELTVYTRGSVADDIQVRRNADDSHFCALAGRRHHEQRLVLAFNMHQTETLLGASDFGFSLSIAGKAGGQWDQTHPSTLMQVSIDNHSFIGLPAINRDFRLHVSTDPDGAKGTFSANHLLDQTGKGAIDIEGTWRCAPAGDPGQQKDWGSGDNAQANADPLRADDPKLKHFRVFHDEPCHGSAACRSWTAADLRSGKTSKASVEFSHLKLASSLLASAQEGKIELWITGEAVRDRQHGLVITAQRLDGTVFRHNEASMERLIAGH
jgi:hypothetical protein